MKLLLCRLTCAVALIAVITSLLYCRMTIIESYCPHIHVGDIVMVNNDRHIGKVTEIMDDGCINVLVQDDLGISKIIHAKKSHLLKVIYCPCMQK